MSRLISDSYMYRAIGAEINGACGKCELSRSDCMCQSLSRMDVCGIIDDAPTVDAVPVVHGEWIEAYGMEEAMKGTVICSNCRESYSAIVLTSGEISLRNQKTKFCPNCGAKMDGKVKKK